jgi:hypothetical protein
MKKAFVAATFILALSFSAIASVMFIDYVVANPVIALTLQTITINRNGSITPETSYIQKAGNVYTLTADIIEEYSILIQCSNIIFDGAGHLIDVAVPGTFSVNGYPAAYLEAGINFVEVNNVTVKNVEISSNSYSIKLQFSSNCQIIGVTTDKSVTLFESSYNNIAESNTGVSIEVGSNNQITRNNINHVFVGRGSSNIFFKNNFYLTDYPEFSAAIWDNGFIGNYWSNYTIKYPNASEIGNTGIGDTPYFIERTPWATSRYPNQMNIDHYPLIHPFDPSGALIVSVLKLENATQSEGWPLSFTVNKPTQWMGYSLDGQDNVTVTGNVTPSGLAPGVHNVTVYALDIYEASSASDTVTFTITKSEPFIAVLVVASSASVVAMSIGLLLYFKKRKRLIASSTVC